MGVYLHSLAFFCLQSLDRTNREADGHRKQAVSGKYMAKKQLKMQETFSSIFSSFVLTA